MLAVIETHEFFRLSEKLLSVDEREDLIDFLAINPSAGDVMAGTGGIRKLRWARADKGKSGGVRIIYLFGGDTMPLVLITLYAKNAKDNLTKAERNRMSAVATYLTATLKG